MKVLTVPPIRLAGGGDMDAALEGVFGPAMLRAVHGPDTQATDFVDGRRTFRFAVEVSDVPPPIRRFFCGSRLRITTRQALDKAADRWTVTNRMKLHFVGAELFKLRPVFWLDRGVDGDGKPVVTLGGRVRHDAVLPPPLNGIAEGFMMLHSQRELLRFAGCLHRAGLIEPEDAAAAVSPGA